MAKKEMKREPKVTRRTAGEEKVETKKEMKMPRKEVGTRPNTRGEMESKKSMTMRKRDKY